MKTGTGPQTGTRPVARALGAAVAVLATALLAGAHRTDPITCSVSSVTVVKYIPVESMVSVPSTILHLEVEPHGPRGALFTYLPPVLTSVTDAGGKEILKPHKPVKQVTSHTGRPLTPREELIATIRRTLRPEPFQHVPPHPGYKLAAFPSTIKELKGRIEVLTGDEVLVPLEIAEGKEPHEVAPGITLVITKITENKQVRLADFQVRIDKDNAGDGAGLEQVLVGIVKRKGGKEQPGHMYDQLTEKEQDGKYVLSGPPPLMLTEADGTPCNWELRLIRNIKRTTVEFECSDIVVRPQH
jgi:hypothetical protein